MTEPIENVDAAELAALERAADGNAAAARPAPPTWHPHAFVPTTAHEQCMQCGYADDDPVHALGAAIHDAPPVLPESVVRDIERDLEPGLGAHPAMKGAAPAGARTASDPTLTPVYMAGPDGKLVPLVEVSAVDQRLARLEDQFAIQQTRLLHTMALVMLLADKFGIRKEDCDRAYAKIFQAEEGASR